MADQQNPFQPQPPVPPVPPVPPTPQVAPTADPTPQPVPHSVDLTQPHTAPQESTKPVETTPPAPQEVPVVTYQKPTPTVAPAPQPNPIVIPQQAAPQATQPPEEERSASPMPLTAQGQTAAGISAPTAVQPPAQVAKPVPMETIPPQSGVQMPSAQAQTAQPMGGDPTPAQPTPQAQIQPQAQAPSQPMPQPVAQPAPNIAPELMANPPRPQAIPQAPQAQPVAPAMQVPPVQPTPVQPASAQPPTPNSPKKQKKPSSGGASLKLLFGLMGVFLFLGVAFYAVLLWGLLGDGIPVEAFAGLGLTESSLQDTLIVLTNSIFGFASFAFLMAFMVRMFQYSMTGKKDVRRRTYGFKTITNFIFLILFAASWVTLYWLITNVDVQREQPTSASLIITDPASVTRLQAPITIKFDIGTRLYQQVPSDQIRKIDWDFNADGEIDASGAEVQYLFQNKGENNGRYPVQATVYYLAASTGSEEQTYQETVDVIIENESVSATITPNVTQGPAPLSVNFSAAESKDPDGSIVRYEWDLDEDGVYELAGPNREQIDFTYEKAGRYTARLRVTGNNSDTAEAEVEINVEIPKNTLKAVINTTDVLSGLSPLEVTLDAEQSLSQFGDIIRYEWFIEGEEGSSLGKKIRRTFYDEGDYQIKLVIENEDGEKAETTQTVTVEEDLGQYEALIRTTPPQDPDDKVVRGTVPFEVAFDSSISNIKNAVEWNWDFESDGINDDFAPAVRKVFREPGTYEVSLSVLDADQNEYTTTQMVEVKGAGLQAKITADKTGGMVPLLVQFDGSGSTIDEGEIIEYIWEFPGSQPISYGPQIEYEFTKLGKQQIKLTVESSTGKRSETQMVVSVRKAAVQADFLPRPAVGAAPLEVLFDPTPSTGTIFQYEWDFGDGKVSDEFQPKHIYRLPGTYEVRLKVTDQDGIISTERKEVIVTEP